MHGEILRLATIQTWKQISGITALEKRNCTTSIMSGHRTHTAVFVKSIRKDGKGIVTIDGIQYNNDPGFIPTIYQPNSWLKIPVYPRSTLGLDSIMLFRTSQLEAALGGVSLLDMKGSGISQVPGESFEANAYAIHAGSDVIDGWDLRSKEEALREISLRSVIFHKDYSLAQGTDNSFDHPTLYSATPSFSRGDYTFYGKLTLKSLRFQGKQGQSVMPPTSFAYDLEKPKLGSFYAEDLWNEKIVFSASDAGLVPGDLLKITSTDGKAYNAIVLGVDSEGRGSAKLTGDLGQNAHYEGDYRWVETKNPVFDKNAFDRWGLFKGDYDHVESSRIKAAQALHKQTFRGFHRCVVPQDYPHRHRCQHKDKLWH